MGEIFDLVTRDGSPLGKTAPRGSVLGPGEYHLVVLAVMTNPEGKILITKRSMHKTAPGKWECTAGSVAAGETSKDAMIREIREETGISAQIPADSPLGNFIEDDALFHVWEVSIRSTLDDLVLQPEEVDDARYVTREELEALVAADLAAKSMVEVLKIHGKII